MADRAGAQAEHAAGLLRARGAARRRGDHDPGPLPLTREGRPLVAVYHAAGCHLCERALATLRRLQPELGYGLVEVDIAGDPALEAAHREWLPVVEIQGRRAFVYHVDEGALRRRLASQSPA